MHEAESFHFYENQVVVVRRPHKRSISLYMKPHQPLLVTASRSTPDRLILQFLEERKTWIQKNLNRFSKMPKTELVHGQRLPLVGEELSLNVVVTLLDEPFASKGIDQIHLHIPREQWCESVRKNSLRQFLPQIRKMYRREAERYLIERVQELSALTGLMPKRVTLREQKARWGSCNSLGHLSLNWKLIVFSKEIIDYVIIHELCHLQHLDHSKSFWQLVSQNCPEYKQAVRSLKSKHTLSDFLQVDAEFPI